MLNNKIYKYFLFAGISLILILININSVYAGGATVAAKVEWMSHIVYNDANYGTYFVIKGEWNKIGEEGCTAIDKVWIVSPPSDSNSLDSIKSMHAMALAAHISNKTLTLYHLGCKQNKPVATGIYMPVRN